MKALLLLCVPLLAQDVVLLRAPSGNNGSERVEQRGSNGVNDRAVMDVSDPSITVYRSATPTGLGILIAPGGAYARLAIDKEGHDVARWLSSQGVTSFVLKYRLPGGAQMRPALGDLAQAAAAAKVAIEDAVDAMQLIRAKYPEVKNLGMMGFSAGGHLASMLGMTASGAARPDFLALIYPAIPKELKIDASTPRTFLVHADDDALSAGDNSARFYQALRAVKVPAEMHVYANGGHGFGIRKTDKTSAAWPAAFESWLKTVPQK